MQSGGFTENAKSALSLAMRTASRLKTGYVGTEHILAGLLKQKTGVAARVLSENGVDEAKLMEMMKELLIADMTVALKEKDDYSPRAKAVLEEAHKQAERFGASETGTEHILLSLVKEGENVGARLLATMGISMQKLYVCGNWDSP